MSAITEDEAKTKWNRGALKAGEPYEKRYPIAERLDDLSTQITESGCIIWMGALNDGGYGRIKIRSRFKRAHIVAWEVVNGPIPDGMVLDHICRVRCCINPAHMNAVSLQENLRRGAIDRKARYATHYCGLAVKP